jgi:hypothetical protein
MNDPSNLFVTAVLIGALAGLLCGLAPFRVALHRRRHDLAFISLAVCTASGLFLGLLLAILAGAVCTAVIMSLERGNPPSDLDRWQETVSQAIDLAPPPPPQAVPEAESKPADREVNPRPPAPEPLALYARSNLRPGETALHCPKCGNTFPAAVTNLPPWCTRCGADLPRPKPQPPAEPTLSVRDDALQKAPSASFDRGSADEAFQNAPADGADA